MYVIEKTKTNGRVCPNPQLSGLLDRSSLTSNGAFIAFTVIKSAKFHRKKARTNIAWKTGVPSAKDQKARNCLTTKLRMAAVVSIDAAAKFWRKLRMIRPWNAFRSHTLLHRKYRRERDRMHCGLLRTYRWILLILRLRGVLAIECQLSDAMA